MKKVTAFRAGASFGKWVVVKQLETDAVGRRKYLCRCECGTERVIAHPHLKNKATSSCGCGRRKEHTRQEIIERVFARWQYTATKRGKEFALSRKQFTKLICAPCTYCGCLEFRFGRRLRGDFPRGGIDRVDNNVGYVFSNCVPCCGVCNAIKGKKSVDNFLHDELIRAERFLTMHGYTVLLQKIKKAESFSETDHKGENPKIRTNWIGGPPHVQ